MGLEAVELLLRIEDEFGIAITSQEAEQIGTPRDLVSLVASKVNPDGRGECLSQRTFHAIRRLTVDEFGAERRSVAPSTALDSLIPLTARPLFWKRISQLIGGALFPRLRLPSGAVATIWSVSAATAAVVWYFTYLNYPSGPLPTLLPIATLVVLSTMGFVFARPLVRKFPPTCRTVGQAATLMLAAAPDRFRPPRRWNQSEIREMVKAIVLQVLSTDKYDEDWEFVRDFGIG